MKLKSGRSAGELWSGESAGVTAQVESEVGDPHLHLPLVPGFDASLQFPSRRPGLSLSFAFLQPLTGSLTTFLEREPPYQHHRGGYTFHFPLFPKPVNSRAHQSAFHSAPDPKTSLPGLVTTQRSCPRAVPGAATAKNVALPSLFGDDHLRLVAVKFQPEGPVAQVHLRFAGYQSGLRGRELVERGSLVGVAVLLWVGVAGRGVALR